MVEKVPDSTYDMVGGLDKQIKEIKEVCENIYLCVWQCIVRLDKKFVNFFVGY